MIMVTGGAGYIGSHTVKQLLEAGERVIVLDNLYSGFRWLVPPGAELVVGDIGDRRLVDEVIAKYKVNAVVHFAAHIQVNESVTDPLKYYRNNASGTLSLIESCANAGVEAFVFSSTCATYGDTTVNPVAEDHSQKPVSPYGRSKLFTEWVLRDLVESQAAKMRYVILRYFNVAGARPDVGLGQATRGATSLIKVAAETAVGKHASMKVFGTDYDTSDGTCVRDYIHVADLADAHVLSVKYLRQGKPAEIFNCGYGEGATVLEVINCMKKVSGVDFKVELAPRRAGDVVAIYADNRKITKALSWKPRFKDLSLICKSTLDFEKSLAARL